MCACGKKILYEAKKLVCYVNVKADDENQQDDQEEIGNKSNMNGKLIH